MSNDWKQKAENLASNLETKEHEENVKKERIRQQAEEQERNRMLSELARKYRCCVCGKGSQKPYTHESSQAGSDYGADTSNWSRVTEWGKPGDMFQCKNCKKWACEDHIHQGICQTCAEKL